MINSVSHLIQSVDGQIAISFSALSQDSAWDIYGDQEFHAGSTMKVAVLVEFLMQVQSGKLDLDEKVVLRNEFPSLVDGSLFSVSPEDDSCPKLYAHLGHAVAWLDLARLMITQSSNLATNVLVQRLGAQQITSTMDQLGCGGIKVLRGVEDVKAYRAGLNNTVTARSLTHLMGRVASGSVLSPRYTQIAIDILLAQEHRNGIPKGLPDGTRCANKAGWTSHVYHDTAIVFCPNGKGYALTVLTEGVVHPLPLIGRISELVYQSFYR